jgi:L-cysteine/cystine lyase
MGLPTDDPRWDWMRHETPATAARVYLNCGWSGPMSNPVADTMRAWIDRELALGPTTSAVSEEKVARRDHYRALMARVFGATPEEVTLTQNTTEGINIVLNGMRFQPGDGVVTTGIEHPSGVVPAYYLRERQGMDVRFVPLDSSLSTGEVVERFAEAMDDRTRIVILSEISYATGQLLPLAPIVDLAHRHGARVVVDGAQTGGHLPLDVRASNVDYYAITAHKWLCGPDGTGALFVRRDLVEELEPERVAGRSAREWDFDGGFEPECEAITKFELTTTSPVLTEGAITALEQYFESGPERVFERMRDLNRYAEQRFDRIAGVTITSPRDDEARTGLFCFRLDGVDSAALSAWMQGAHGIVCRSVASEGVVRLSIHVYNTTGDLDAAAEAVEQAAREGLPEDVGAGASEH